MSKKNFASSAKESVFNILYSSVTEEMYNKKNTSSVKK